MNRVTRYLVLKPDTSGPELTWVSTYTSVDVSVDPRSDTTRVNSTEWRRNTPESRRSSNRVRISVPWNRPTGYSPAHENSGESGSKFSPCCSEGAVRWQVSVTVPVVSKFSIPLSEVEYYSPRNFCSRFPVVCFCLYYLRKNVWDRVSYRSLRGVPRTKTPYYL